MKGFRSLREEIHAIVTEAKRAGRPISANLIWGIVSRNRSLKSVTAELTYMQRGGQVVAKAMPAGTFRDNRAHLAYEPGPNPLPVTGRVPYRDTFLGAREMVRLENARACARLWLRNAKAAA